LRAEVAFGEDDKQGGIRFLEKALKKNSSDPSVVIALCSKMTADHENYNRIDCQRLLRALVENINREHPLYSRAMTLLE